jgi:hypothetical protein
MTTVDPLQHVGYIALPKHHGKGAFDHAAVHAASGHVYVAHTANDAVDVFDPASAKHLFTIGGLPATAGVLVSDESQLIIAANRAENTIGIFAPGPDPQVFKIDVGLHPNGLAYDAMRRLILVANVGDPAIPGSHTLSVVDLDRRTVQAEIEVAGRTRWAIYDPESEAFYVNIADPPQIAIVEARDPSRLARVFAIPAAGPHGLDLDPATHRLFCACDARTLVTLDARSGKDHESAGPERHARRRVLQSPPQTPIRRRRRPWGDRCLRHHDHEPSGTRHNGKRHAHAGARSRRRPALRLPACHASRRSLQNRFGLKHAAQGWRESENIPPQ